MPEKKGVVPATYNSGLADRTGMRDAWVDYYYILDDFVTFMDCKDRLRRSEERKEQVLTICLRL